MAEHWVVRSELLPVYRTVHRQHGAGLHTVPEIPVPARLSGIWTGVAGGLVTLHIEGCTRRCA